MPGRKTTYGDVMAISATSNALVQLLQASGAGSPLSFQAGGGSLVSTASGAASGGPGSVSDKLKNLQKQAETVQQQADSAIKIGRRDRLSAMSSQISSILDSVNAVVGGLTGGGASSAAPGASLKDNQQAISSVLSTVNSTLAELSILVPKDSSPASGEAGTTLSQLSSRTGTLARQAGVSLQKATSAGVAAGMASRSPHLVDLLV